MRLVGLLLILHLPKLIKLLQRTAVETGVYSSGTPYSLPTEPYKNISNLIIRLYSGEANQSLGPQSTGCPCDNTAICKSIGHTAGADVKRRDYQSRIV
ncbi:hypothetical protein RRG08_008846 [Elysia crispata]|uniref:Secreted protein n=1 Tax=Elysia crispata TaxID=231223 RepID=A0AAE1DUK7_9GAST|nr:hypothetical protein RRG08_008846 [Elysia crispata]